MICLSWLRGGSRVSCRAPDPRGGVVAARALPKQNNTVKESWPIMADKKQDIRAVLMDILKTERIFDRIAALEAEVLGPDAAAGPGHQKHE